MFNRFCIESLEYRFLIRLWRQNEMSILTERQAYGLIVSSTAESLYVT
jgi:hypothetical protein